MLHAERIKIEKLQKVRRMKNKGKRNREKPVKDLEKEYSKKMCVEQTGKEKIKLEDTDYDNNKDYEQKPRISPCGFFWDGNSNLSLDKDKESSSDSEDEVEEKPKLRNKKLSAAERREQERQKEGEIRQREEALANNQLPNSVDQFDRLVLASPDSSIVWLQYMAYHLQATEIEKEEGKIKRLNGLVKFRI